MVITTHNVDNDNAMQSFYISQQCLYANQNLVAMLDYYFEYQIEVPSFYIGLPKFLFQMISMSFLYCQCTLT